MSKDTLFIRWLWLVYVPLGLFMLGLPLVLLGMVSGMAAWPVALLAVYCAVPARLVLETRRKGLELPRPRGAVRQVRPRPGNHSYPVSPVAKGASGRTHPAGARLPATRGRRASARITRRRVLAGMIGLGLLMGIGGVLVIVGIDALRSSLGTVLLGLGAFMIIASVTIPAFALLAATLRAVGRMLKDKPTPRPLTGGAGGRRRK